MNVNEGLRVCKAKTAVGLLGEEGKIGWDDPVIEHLSWFRLSDPYVTRDTKSA